MLGARDLDSFYDVTQTIGGPDNLAVLNDPVQLILGRGGLSKGT